jgi:hypothetical protein
MIKATGTLNGRKTLMIGLSFGNLDRFRAEPDDTFIKIDGKEMGLGSGAPPGLVERLRAWPQEFGVMTPELANEIADALEGTIDVLIFSGRTEAHMAKLMQPSIGPGTKVHIDPKLKS